MREIKFRAWDENSQEMIYEIGITPEGIPYSIPDNAEASDQFNYYPSCHKMQYTGLKDKNGQHGQEIWEGDIRKDVFGRIFVVVYDNDLAAFYGEYPGGIDQSLADCGPDSEYLGTVYENPDLLEAKR
ncbi:YopX family protein [Bacillus sonorensis]|uniref:YopX family protein n=1 Tax=Bacillus sonorensis TaxID=119858 RepID=UPI002DBE6545|nr:YopX family protein [Bacillus sonorensis]MEC1426683.1 YopX family protein [Bacillus sonorensis]